MLVFLKVIYDKINMRRACHGNKTTNLGLTETTALHIEVSKQIENYPDFCKSCKPRKKK
jgi:hypothetical protein